MKARDHFWVVKGFRLQQHTLKVLKETENIWQQVGKEMGLLSY